MGKKRREYVDTGKLVRNTASPLFTIVYRNPLEAHTRSLVTFPRSVPFLFSDLAARSDVRTTSRRHHHHNHHHFYYRSNHDEEHQRRHDDALAVQ